MSASAFVLGVMTAALFTSGYLSVFGSGLIWLVQYSDLVKIGLVITVFLLGFTWAADSYAYIIIDLFKEGVSRKRRIITGLILLGEFAVFMAIQFYFDSKKGRDRTGERIIFICLVFLLST
jgi:MFS family permease